MIKFFRRIRKNLLTDNKFSKYILYAIGEIILVVIGILLALTINNRNEKKINNEKFINIFKEIQDNLIADTERATYIFDDFLIADSIQDLILNNKYTEEDYKSKKAQRLGNYYEDFVINTNGYDNLISNIDNIPNQYQPILKDLKNLYEVLKSDIDVYNKRIRETVYKSIDYTYNLEWYQKAVKGIKTEEEINYYLSSSHYKGQVIKYVNDRSNILSVSQRYKRQAAIIYHKINDLIENKESVNELMVRKPLNMSLYKKYLGSYKLHENFGVVPFKKISITEENGEFYMTVDDFKSKQHWHKDNVFYLGGSFYCVFDKSKKGELFFSGNIGGYATYLKNEE